MRRPSKLHRRDLLTTIAGAGVGAVLLRGGGTAAVLAEADAATPPRIADSATRDAWAQAPAPRVVMPDVHVVRGAKEARVRAWLEMPDGSRPARAFSLHRSTRNGSMYLGQYGDIAGGRTFFPHAGCALEFVIPLKDPAAAGDFTVHLTHSEDHPQLAQAICTVHVADALPAGYAPPPPLKARAAPVPPRPRKPPLLRTDFLEDFRITADGGPDSFAGPTGNGTLNGAQGAFVTPGVTRTVSGKPLDTLPVIDGVRHMRVLDQRADPVRLPDGGTSNFAMPFLSTRGRIAPPFGLFRLRTAFLRIPGLDDARWRLPAHGVTDVYREHDLNEQYGDKSLPRWAINQHRSIGGVRGPTQGHQPFLDIPPGTIVTHDVLIEPDRIRTFVGGTLIDEARNLMDPVPMFEIISIEGWGGAAAGPPVAGYEAMQPSKPLILYEVHAL